MEADELVCKQLREELSELRQLLAAPLPEGLEECERRLQRVLEEWSRLSPPDRTASPSRVWHELRRELHLNTALAREAARFYDGLRRICEAKPRSYTRDGGLAAEPSGQRLLAQA
jgi:thiamine pyrophosphate-dependent acetolactate synthase large subunit-like protein